MKRLEVHKFGGTSVADSDRIRDAAQLIAQRAKESRLIVVSSATAGTTDQLVSLGKLAAQGQMEEVRSLVSGLLTRHLKILDELGDEEAGELALRIQELLDVVKQLSEAVGIQQELTERVHDRILPTGEKLAVRLFALALRKQGIPAEACDADQFLETDACFGQASALSDVSDRSVRAHLNPLLVQGVVPIVTGYCGRAPDGATTTLGRGGSDLSATLIGAAMEADEVTIWTDVDGVLSANPKVVPNAKVISFLNYREAAEMSYYGAKVLHQRTMIPAARKNIPIWTRNSKNTSAPGTLVDGRITPGSHPIKAVSAIRGHALISIEGKGMAGVAGFSARLFSAIARHQISVTMYSQSSSEASICLALPHEDIQTASDAIREEFQLELMRGDVEEIAVKRDVGMVAVVGLGMAQSPGVAGRTMGALGEKGINILAIAQGSSELNITLAVEESDVDNAVRALHVAFGLHRADTGSLTPDGLDLILFGVGKIGRALAQLVMERRNHIRERFGLSTRIVALADTSGFILQPNGFEHDRLLDILKKKDKGISIADQEGGVAGKGRDVVHAALGYRLMRPILVDMSDADDADESFCEAFQRGCDVVTANKKPMAGNQENFSRLLNTAKEQGRVLKAETTVGAGLPVIDTLEILLDSGDCIHSAEGSLSGTLSFIMSRLEVGELFSAAVAEAYKRRFTEPDPVVDLSGADVARKAIILGRLSGLINSDVAVELEGLVDPSWGGMAISDLLEKLKELDGPIADRVEAARKNGHVLRYLARVERGRMQVGPISVPADSPAGRLGGTENLILFRSDRYDTIPLVITGPGAGIEVTAMGVFGDILRVAAQRGST
ncbi:MAG: bifunctional aspartate kinase/homoserine dehydrogenase I [Proteobacteria bacterium]|nr:bifunctional aspartate kinase/homoserine dehydrogenase I [Pseudomonadota bacterium]